MDKAAMMQQLNPLVRMLTPTNDDLRRGAGVLVGEQLGGLIGVEQKLWWEQEVDDLFAWMPTV